MQATAEISASRADTRSSPAEPAPGRANNIGTWVFALIVIGILIWGWSRRNDGWLNAEHGLGYMLGICGSAMMLALLTYPLRKRARFMRALGPVSFWFRLHMFLGVAGPIVILFHANFAAESMNSTVALTAMLTVATSGLVGRYFHGKLHLGLYGRRAGARDLVAGAARIRRDLNEKGILTPRIEDRMRALEERALAPRVRFTAAATAALAIPARSRRLHRSVRRQIGRTGARLAWERRWPAAIRRRFRRQTRGVAAKYFRMINKAAQFALFERLFALWHLLHVPLFLILILTVVLHVVAVHMY